MLIIGVNCNIYSAAGLKCSVCHEFCWLEEEQGQGRDVLFSAVLPAALVVLGWSSGLRDVWVVHFPGLLKLRYPEYRPWPGCVENTKLAADFCHKLLLQMCSKGDRHAQVRIVCTGQRLLAIWRPRVLSTEESIFMGTKYFPPVFKSRGNIFVFCSFLDWRAFGISWEWVFQCSLCPTKWGVLVFSVSKEQNNVCGES